MEKNMTLIIILGIVGAIVLAAIGIYNALVVLRNRFKNAFAQIDVQLKRRYDLIPNLVEAVKGYMAHERETLEAVVKARSAAMGAASAASANPGDPAAMTALAGAESSLKGHLARLMVVVERYPDLKANQNMMALQEELTSTENKVSFARQAYNDAVDGGDEARDEHGVGHDQPAGSAPGARLLFKKVHGGAALCAARG